MDRKTEILKGVYKIIENDSISVSKLQRCFIIGYSRAFRLMQELIEAGAVIKEENCYKYLSKKKAQDVCLDHFDIKDENIAINDAWYEIDQAFEDLGRQNKFDKQKRKLKAIKFKCDGKRDVFNSDVFKLIEEYGEFEDVNIKDIRRFYKKHNKIIRNQFLLSRNDCMMPNDFYITVNTITEIKRNGKIKSYYKVDFSNCKIDDFEVNIFTFASIIVSFWNKLNPIKIKVFHLYNKTQKERDFGEEYNEIDDIYFKPIVPLKVDGLPF